MNPAAPPKAKQAFTLIELLVVVVIVGVLLAMLLPAGTGNREPAKQTQCMSNLRQVGVGFWFYHQDNSNQPPWQVSGSEGDVAADYFLKLKQYLPTPKLLICPTDKARQGAISYVGLSNTNLSYFATGITPLALTSSPSIRVLAGDRHLAFSNQPVQPGLFSVTNSTAMSWTKELHLTRSKQPLGILLFVDGHTTPYKAEHLPNVLGAQSPDFNHLAVP